MGIHLNVFTKVFEAVTFNIFLTVLFSWPPLSCMICRPIFCANIFSNDLFSDPFLISSLSRSCLHLRNSLSGIYAGFRVMCIIVSSRTHQIMIDCLNSGFIY